MGRLTMSVAVVLSLVNIAMFGLWWSLVRVEAQVPANEESTYVLSAISVQLSILQAVLAAVALGLAVLGVLGYQSIREEAVRRSLEATSKETQAFLSKSQDAGGVSGASNAPPQDGLGGGNIEREGGEV